MKSKKIKIVVLLIVLFVIVTIGVIITNKTGLLENISRSSNKKENHLDKLIGMPLEDALRYVEELGYENWQSEPDLIETTDENLHGKVESYDISNNIVFLRLYALKDTTLNPHGLWASLSEDELALITNYLEQKAKDKYKDRYLGYKVNIVDDILYFSDIYADDVAVSFEGQGYYPKNLYINWQKENIENLFELKNIIKVPFNNNGSYAANSVRLSKRYNVSEEEINSAKTQLFDKIDLSIEKEKTSKYKEVSKELKPYYPFSLTAIKNLGNDDYNNKIDNCLKETTLSANDNIFINASIRDAGGSIFKGTFKNLSDYEYVYFNSICHKVETDNWNQEPKYEYITYAVKYKMNIQYSLCVEMMTLEQLLKYKYIEVEEFEMPNAIVVSEHELNENNYYEQYKTIFEKMNLTKELLFAEYGCKDVGSFHFASNGEVNGWTGGKYKIDGNILTLSMLNQNNLETIDKVLKGEVLNDYFVKIDGNIYNAVFLYTDYRDSWIKNANFNK